MTREKAIDLLDNLIGMVEDNQESDYDTALKMAIQALSQDCVEPTHKHVGNALDMRCDDAVSRQYLIDIATKDGAYDYVSAQEIADAPSVNSQPCDDAISRDAVIRLIRNENSALKDIFITHSAGEELSKQINELPSVTPSRYVNCEIAEHDGNGCLGYSHYGDDFPVKECLHCPKYTSYEKE